MLIGEYQGSGLGLIQSIGKVSMRRTSRVRSEWQAPRRRLSACSKIAPNIVPALVGRKLSASSTSWKRKASSPTQSRTLRAPIFFFPADLSDAAANADGPAIALKRFPVQMPFSPSVAIGGCRWHVRNERRSALRPLLKAYANAFPPVPNEVRPPFAQTHACQ